uniref:Protein NPAT C-terminal domain-containing protein n=1 Tax=Anabas testudineus TaxID=64144 RepID=A0AAQ6ICV3_ANATE
MLLPSDVARLVLGYLQEEGLTATSQAFIHESPNLKEYAEHTTADGTIPACVFSVFGKGLTTILNEYVAAKTKESCHEVPAMLTSLWKKLDFTLNQIKSLQNSPAISANQRTRSRIGVANMARQRVLAVASTAGVICSSVSETSSIISPAHTSHSIINHSTPISYTALQTRPASGSGTPQQIHDGNRQLNMPKDSSVQIIISEQRLNPGPMSPGRRKWETPRKRSGAQSGSSGSGRSATTVCSLNAEPQPEEVVDENFPQLVIQNARDKILGDRLLQEKLAENINKILANEPTPQTSKTSSSTVEADQSIDEILGLQGEIHMSDDAIHDILEQTESDPAFQALFDLFDYNKTKFPDGDPGDGEVSSIPEDSDTAGSSSIVRPLQTDDPGTTNSSTAALETTQMTVKMRAGQDRKTRKSTAPTLLKKTALAPSSRASRIENSSPTLLVSHPEHRGISSADVDSNRKNNALLFNNSVTPMETDVPLSTLSPPSSSISTQESSVKSRTSTSTGLSESTAVPSTRASAAITMPLVISACNVVKTQEYKQAQGSKDQLSTAPSSALSSLPAFLSTLPADLNTPTPTAGLSQMSISSSGGDAQPLSTESSSSVSASSRFTVTAVSVSPPASTGVPFTTTSGSPTSASTSAILTATPASSTLTSPTLSSSSAPVAATPDSSITESSTTTKAATDSNNIVSLKIIISDNQEEESSTDTALNQAISSISGDKIPTIYLSSPAKSPGCPGTPKVNLDEAAQAVSGLQNSEAYASPLSSKAGALVTSPLPGTSQAQQSYIIQLPQTNPVLQGTAASYVLVSESPTTDTPTRQLILPAGVSKGQPLSTNPYGVNAPARSQGYSTGSALILPSPVKPLMLPVSVMGQNTIGNVQMVSNQLVAMAKPVPIQQTESVKPKTTTVAVKQSSTAGTEQNVTGKVIQPASAETASQKDAAKGSSHRRILIFESSAEVHPQTAETTRNTTPSTANTLMSRSVQQTEKDNTQLAHRTKPTILGGNKPKRRIETVRCSTDPQAQRSLVKETDASMRLQQKDPVKKNSRKQDHNIRIQVSHSASTSRTDFSQPEALKKPESGGQSKPVDRKHNHDKSNEAKTKSLSCDSALKSGSRKDKEESGRQEPVEKAPAKSCEVRTEKRVSSQESPNVTANKENEMKGRMQEQQQQSTPSPSPSRDFSPPVVIQPTINTQSMATKAPSKTSSLAKQAAEMLQDIQGLNSPTSGVGNSDLILARTPGTGHNQEESGDCLRTPSRQKKGKDGEGTPKHLMPPNTPDVPTCSPASEAGSENSINMAAHTLMILSRAAIARTGTPLKDSLRQEGVGEKSTTGSKISKKRKQSSPTASPPAKKELKQSPNKKKDRVSITSI